MKLLQKSDQLEDTEWLFRNRKAELKLLWMILEELGLEEMVKERRREWAENTAERSEESGEESEYEESNSEDMEGEE